MVGVRRGNTVRYRRGMSVSRLPCTAPASPMAPEDPPVRVWPPPMQLGTAAASPPAPWPLHGAQGSRASEQAAQAELPPFTLMRRAGTAVARLALAVAPHARRVWVACGPGNNGGDGLVAAAWLHRAGRAVSVSLVGDPARLPADAARALEEARAAGVPIQQTPVYGFEPRGEDLAIDALLGLGSSRRPEGPLGDAVAALRRWPGPVLAVDLPTGLDGETGRVFDTELRACVRADHTLSLLTLKPGLFTAQGRDHAGTVWWHDLGAPTVAPDAWLASEGAVQAVRPARLHAHHKGSFGDVIVVAGAPGMVGAALLAARAAVRAGGGRVYLVPLAEDAFAVDPTHPELMVRPLGSLEPMLRAGTGTVVCGCGGGSEVAQILPAVLHAAPRLVLDADALNTMAADEALRTLLSHRGARGAATILTPHPLEAARLLGSSSADVQANRVAAARELAGRLRVTVVLKGSGTVIAGPEGPSWINPTGNAALATPGTGDVLAGWLGGTWRPGEAALDAAVRAVWEHGAAADRWAATHRGPYPASELAEAI